MKKNQHSSWLRYTTLSVFAFFAFIITLNAQTRDSFKVAGSFQWTAPCNVTAIQVEAWGSGGGGGVGNSGGSGKAGGGGAGGAYVKNTSIIVVPGNTYTVTVGAGGLAGVISATVTTGNPSSFSGSGITTLTAGGGAGGGGGSAATPGTGGVGSSSANAGYSGSFSYAGGNGAAGVTSSYSGGGGGAAGSSGAGGNASGATKGTAGTGGGDGGNGITGGTGTTGNPGTTPGGGGSGGFEGSLSVAKLGGKGGDGRVIITYTISGSTICTSGTLSALSTTFGVASSNTSFTAFASGLSANLALAAPSGFEISTSSGSGFSSSLSLTPNNGIVAPTIIYVRLAAATAAGTYSGNVVLSSTGATSVNVATVSSTVSAPVPALSVSPTTINFTATVVGTPTTGTAVTVTAANLTSNITIDAPNGFEVSLSNAPFSALSLPYSSYSSAGGTVYVRFNPSIGGSYSFTSSNGVSFAATGVSNQYINVTGAATSAEPTAASTASFGTVTSSSIVVNFSGGNGSNRIVVLKPLTAASYTPTDGTAVDSVNSDFTLAKNQGSGNKVVYDGTGNTVTVTNLPPGLYYVSVIEYNTAGTAATNNYLTSATGIGNTYTLTTSGNTSYPIIGDANGGFEAQTTGNMISGSSSATALNTSTWTASTATSMTRTVTATGGRSGPKYVTAGPTSATTTNKTIYSPQISDIVLPNKTYQVQFFYKNPNAGAPTVSTADLYANNTSLNGTPPPGTVQSSNITLSSSVSSWTKFTTSITTNTTVAPTTNNVFGITIAQPSTSTTYLVDYDDYVIYEGNAADSTSPNSPASVNATGSTGSINVSWSAPSGGVDGGGYVVVRYASNPNANDDPLQNGIYAVGNTVAGSVAGTVRYVGTGTSFTDNVGIVGAADYYYKVYAVDKAYNYSPETQYGPVQSLITTFYYAGSGSLANVNSWGTNTDGSGTKPVDFITDAQKFEIVNATAVSTDVPWTVSGASSKIILGSAFSAAVTLTVANGARITGPLDIAAASSGANSLIVNDSLPVIGTCDANSEVHIRINLSSANAGTYGKLFIENNATDSLTGTPSIRNLTIDAGATLISGTATGNYIVIPSGGSVIVNGKIATPKTPGLVSSLVTTPGLTFATLQFMGVANLTFGSNATVDFCKIATSTTQTIDALTYANLTMSGTSPKTFAAGTLTVSGNFTITSTGTLTQPSATSIVLNGTSSQAIPSQITTYSNLSVCGGAKTMSANASVTGVLNLNCGIIQTGSNTLSVTSTGSVTRTSGWVFGNLRKFVATGSNVSRTFEIGDASNYSPIAATFNTVTTAGDIVGTVASPITASPNYGTMPHIATANGYINKYWTLTNANSLAFNNYTAAITFASGDVVAGATPATVTVNHYTNAWASYTPTYTGNTDTVSGLTGLGTFTLVVPCTVYTPSVSISSTSNAVCTGSSVTFTATPTNGGSAPSYQWKKNGTTNIGTNSANLVLQDNQVTTGDIISCVMTANNVCQTISTVTSNLITLNVGTVSPSVSISTAKDTICSGANTIFTAVATNGGSSPNYQWKKNGVDAGSGSTITFLSNTLSNGDVISCVLTANNPCQTSATANSNEITMTVKQSPAVAQISNGIATITSATLCTLGSTYKYYDAAPYGTWSSSNPSVASVTGSSQAGVVTANANGTATISYNIAATNGCLSTASIVLTLAEQTVPAAISGTNSICVGATTTLSSTAPVGTTGVWSTSNDRGVISTTSGSSTIYTAKNAGTWGEVRYTVTNASGCKAFAAYTITVNPTPVVPTITYAPGTTFNPQLGAPTGGFCVGRKFRVAATPNVPAGVWTATGAASIAGTDTVKIDAVGVGSIKYTYTSAAGCVNSRTMNATGYTCAARGLNTVDVQLSTVNGFTMYPNPAKGFINLNIETLIGAGSIVVTDLYGKTVKTQNLSMGANTVNIANLSKGMYFVSTITNEGKTTKKLIVE